MSNIVNDVHDKLSGPLEEAYRVLRTNIQFYGIDKVIKTLTITSCNPGEGKTTTSINLAISLAKSGIKVLLIDADLRKPALAKHLGVINSAGISNYILGHAEFGEVINSTNIDNFYFVTCGPKPPNPTELVGSLTFTEFLKTAEEKFEMIIIDTPPLGSVIDCAVIAAQTDGVIMVIEAKNVAYQQAQRVKEQLEKVGAKILGVVLNKVKRDDYRYYYNYYNYYGSKSKSEKKISGLKRIFAAGR